MGNSSNSQNQRKNSQNGAKNRRNRRNNTKNRQNHANSVAVNNNSTNSANATQKPYNNSRNNYAGEKNTTPSGNTRIIAEESENTSKNASASASKNHKTNTRTNTESTAKKPRNVEISTLSEDSTAENASVERSSRRNRRHRRHVDFDSIVDEAETLDNNHTNAHTTTNSRSSRSDRRRKNGQNYAQNGENEEKPVKTGWSEDEMSVILDSTTMGAIKRNNALFFWEIDGLLKSNGTQHSWVYLKNNPPKLTFKRPKEQPFTIFLGKEEVNQLAPALEAVRKAYNAVPIQEKKKEKWTLHNFANIFKNKFYENPGLMVAKIAAIVVMIGIAVFALCL